MPIGVLQKSLSRNLEDHGLPQTIKKVVLFALKPVATCRSYFIYMAPVEGAKVFTVRNPQFNYKWIATDDEHLISQIEGMAEWLQGRISFMLADRCICLAALDRDTVAGFNLVDLEYASIPLLNYRKKLEPGVAWSEQISVRKKYRKMGLGSELRYSMFGELAKRGISKFYGGTQVSNAASLRLATATGFQIVAKVCLVSLLGFERLYYKRMGNNDEGPGPI